VGTGVVGSAEQVHSASPAVAALAWVMILLAPAAAGAVWRGEPLEQLILSLRQEGLPVLYSSDLVQPGMRVAAEPAGETPLSKLAAALQPFGLGVRAGPYGSVLVVRTRVPATGSLEPVAVAAGPTSVPELIVTTSRYEMLREPAAPSVALANTDLERLPDLGDDPLRAVGRLPGTATNGLSSKANLRGGAADETLVTFDDLRLFNPFHLKDFQSIFSAIDPAVIGGLNVYTGAFPAAYGDRLSGVVAIEPFEPTGDGYRALAVSLFNAAGLVAGGWNGGQGTWLVSARRGNLDLVLDLASQDVGKPRYSDLRSQVAWEFSERFKLSANALVFDDNISLSDNGGEEQATARYHDSYLWLRADARPTDKLEGYTLLSYTTLRADRTGTNEQPGVSTGFLDEHRSAEIAGMATRWSLFARDVVRLDFGGEVRIASAGYAYRDEVDFDILFDTPGVPTESSRARNIALDPDGEYYAAFLHARIDLSREWATELGLRWDRSTLGSSSGNLSPRVSLLYAPTEGTQLRASWGQYWQSQGIDELAVNDGETTFATPERADQFVLGLEQALSSAASLRIEAYTKDYRNPRDRYESLLNSFTLSPELKPDRIRVSAESAAARGVEVSIRYRDRGGLGWWGSYSWSSARDTIDGVEYRRSWDQSDALSAGILWTSGPWDLSAAANYRTGWPTTAAAVEEDGPDDLVATGPRNAERLGNYATLDLRAARRFTTRAGLVSVFFEISNALNRANECCVDYGIDVGDTDEFILETEQNLPLLPSLGVSWQF
ncbi:MAG: TonB-dependent receptor, partial [Gammaproteobacteria bacterium]